MISSQPQNTIPHRDPFIWVTRLMQRDVVEGGIVRGVVELDLDIANPIFRGHFPSEPVFPGVLQIEAGAQACLWILLGPQEPGALMPDGLLISIDGFKFRSIVKPPGTVQITCEKIKQKSWLQYWKCEISYGGKLCASGHFWLGLNPPSRSET